MEDHIDDREESDHEEDQIVKTTPTTRPYTVDSDEEGEAKEINPWDILNLWDDSKHTLEHRLRNSISAYQRFL